MFNFVRPEEPQKKERPVIKVPQPEKRKPKIHCQVKRTPHAWRARVQIGKKVYQRTWGIAKFGEQNARMAATLQRTLWLLESRSVDFAEGDPFRFLSFQDTMGDNVVENIYSPHVEYGA